MADACARTFVTLFVLFMARAAPVRVSEDLPNNFSTKIDAPPFSPEQFVAASTCQSTGTYIWKTASKDCLLENQINESLNKHHIHKWPPSNFLFLEVFKEIRITTLPSTTKYVILESFSVFGSTVTKLWLFKFKRFE